VDRYFRETYQLGEEYSKFSGESDSPYYKQYGEPYKSILTKSMQCDEKSLKRFLITYRMQSPRYSARAEPFYDDCANYESKEIVQKREEDEAYERLCIESVNYLQLECILSNGQYERRFLE